VSLSLLYLIFIQPCDLPVLLSRSPTSEEAELLARAGLQVQRAELGGAADDLRFANIGDLPAIGDRI